MTYCVAPSVGRLSAALMAAVLTAACTGSDDESAPKAKSSTTRASQPVAEEVTGVPVNLPQRHVCRDVPPLTPPPSTKPVTIFLACLDHNYGDYAVGVTRHVPTNDDPFVAAFRELLQGPTPKEREAGLFANFTADETGDMLLEAHIEGTKAIVNLNRAITSVPVMGNVSTSSGGGGFGIPLLATAFGFPQVEEVHLQIDGVTFAGHLESEGPLSRKDGGDPPKAPVPANWRGALGAAMYVGPALERFATQPWFKALEAVTWDGSGIGVRADLDDELVAREIALAVTQLLAQTERFCDVLWVTVRNGLDDRSNLAHVPQERSSPEQDTGC